MNKDTFMSFFMISPLLISFPCFFVLARISSITLNKSDKKETSFHYSWPFNFSKLLSHVRFFVTLRIYSPWTSLGKNTGVGGCSLLQGIFPTQGSNPGLPHCRQILYQKPKNTGVGSLSLLHGVFLTQESNWGLLHCRRILDQLSYKGSPFLILILLLSMILDVRILLMFFIVLKKFSSIPSLLSFLFSFFWWWWISIRFCQMLLLHQLIWLYDFSSLAFCYGGLYWLIFKCWTILAFSNIELSLTIWSLLAHKPGIKSTWLTCLLYIVRFDLLIFYR